jgi:hypothetical protein
MNDNTIIAANSVVVDGGGNIAFNVIMAICITILRRIPKESPPV